MRTHRLHVRLPKRNRGGRPKTYLVEETQDSGTPELQAKHAALQTAEALDILLKRELITANQHWCGIHLRWLYTLRYGTPNLQALDPLHFGGRELPLDSPCWQAYREDEFREAIFLLCARKLDKLIVNLCIYNELPSILTKAHKVFSARDATAITQSCTHINEGLDMLVGLWCSAKQSAH